jgi:hypothetical protein
MTPTQFNQASSILCGRMASLDIDTRVAAANEASILIASLPKQTLNEPSLKGEFDAIKKLIAKNAN